MQIRILTALLVVVVGCDANGDFSDGMTSNPQLDPFQGDWIFDNDRYLAEVEKPSTTDEQRQQLMRINAAFKQTGLPIHANIRIEGDRATGINGILQPQYDFYDLSEKDGKVSGTALWHEDRHDPGDASEVDFSLYMQDEWLVLQIGYGAQDEPVKYFFRKQQ